LPCASLTPAGEERCAVDFIVLLGMLAETFPRAPVIVICDNDSIHHAVSWPGRRAADPRFLPQPLTGQDADHRRVLDQSLTAADTRYEQNFWNAA
jgi:hypothetical protein